jgi:hypothetical protein
MRKLSLIVAICSAVISAPVIAQNVSYECQYIESGGLKWENKQWKVTRFTLRQPFFLTASNSKLTLESVAKLFDSPQINVFCHSAFEKIQSCSDSLGRSLIVELISMSGAISLMFGELMPDNGSNGNLSVSPFTCREM